MKEKTDVEALKRRLTELNEQRTKYIFQLVHGKQMVRGLSREVFRRCGKTNCRCVRGKLHGPYAALSVNKDGRKRMIMIRKEDTASVVKKSKRFRYFKKTQARIRKINREIDNLLEEIKELTTVEYPLI